ncbi:CYFA0S13e01640g1_1 [Cyberlindnera fabianii]|uniref:protein S-acyltransferase n=1 Tax=Cyberlindnera fabianii TaxID=36022 RepID=A0A061B299_CYBFA|nr:CYFA0S13e01640g1_1 [Cyberlindnera fabianii]
MSQQTLTQEEKEIIIEDARYGDLETLQEIFGELPGSLILECIDSETQVTPIHMASANGHFDTVKYLLEQVPRESATSLVNRQNFEGNTALHWAALNGHLKVVELLCDEYEADAFLKNKFGNDAIYEAEKNGREEVETYFLKKFDVEPVGEDGEVDVNVSSNDVEVNPGKEIDQISKEQMNNIESNEKFLEERTANMKI